MISIGCDKAGTPFVERFCKELADKNIECKVLFDGKEDGCDYTDAAFAVSKSVASGESELGILICGTGIGMAMTANKVKGIRAAVCHDIFSTERSVKSNNAQIMCMGARIIAPETAIMLMDIWLDCTFPGGNSQQKVEQICKYEDKNFK